MTADWRGPLWLKPFLGASQDSIFHRITGVQLNSRNVPEALLKLRYLEDVNLNSCQMSRDQFERLARRGWVDSSVLRDNFLREDVARQLEQRERTETEQWPFADQTQDPATLPICFAWPPGESFVCPTNKGSGEEL